MKTGLKFTAALVLTAVFTGAFANEAVVEEIVVVGQRGTGTLDVAHPAAPQVKLESIVPAIEFPALEIELVRFAADQR